MVSEETEHQRVLAEAYSDAELLAIEHSIVGEPALEQNQTRFEIARQIR